MIELFEREFLESQELAGITLIGQFRMAGDADRFVWLRGFADMETRAAALASFYGGPVWAAHRAAANATMLDSDNVLLLRPAYPGSGFAISRFEPFPTSAAAPARSTYVARIRHLGARRIATPSLVPNEPSAPSLRRTPAAPHWLGS